MADVEEQHNLNWKSQPNLSSKLNQKKNKKQKVIKKIDFASNIET